MTAMSMVRDHWFRDRVEPGWMYRDMCAFHDCYRPQADHVESCGEWMDPVHWFRPSLRHPFTVCVRCGRHPAHSTHRGSKKGRSLRSR